MGNGDRAGPADRPDPARVVADADVLAADLLVGDEARSALDHVRRHSWVDLVATPRLLDDAEAIVASLADEDLAADWRDRVEVECVLVDGEPGDHPALAAAYHGGAAHLLSFDEGLASASAGVALREILDTSVRHPRAFARVFDAESLYRAREGEKYPGPDRNPRG